jgi:transposase InsO family protein
MQGGFNLCNWLSNSEEMMKQIPQELHAKSVKSLESEKELAMERVLGLFWKPVPDSFTFSLSFVRTTGDLLSGDRMPTKRELLSLTMSIFDPLGFIAVLTIKARRILQTTWRSKIDWNDEIPPEAQDAWTSWIAEVKLLPTFQIPRCYSNNFSSADEIQLHVFGDASSQSFGSVAYFLIKKGTEVDTAFVMAKAKVAPMKPLSIPRMELQAAVMNVRLACFIQEEIEIKVNKIVYWSDSSTVLSWVRSDGNKFHQFVAHRIGEIQECSNANQWRWVPTALNPADELTRAERPCDWSPGSRWLNGPAYLKLSEESWPEERQPSKSLPEEAELEMRSSHTFSIQASKPIVDPTKFSSWRRLVGVTAHVMRYLKKLQRKAKVKNCTMLRVEEIEDAERWWWKWTQSCNYPAEIVSLKKGEPVPKTSSLVKLSPYLDAEGVMRVRGRIDQAEGVPISVKRPVILHQNNPYTKLLVSHFHQKCGHHGHEKIVNELRQQFYVPHIRTAVKKAKLECQHCKNLAAKPIIPEMGSLPKFRLESHVYPFSNTGLDYFGPIEVVVKRSREKRYGVIFTCLSTRAIHLEIAHSLSADACILALRRFVGRRGCPKHMYSDNGTNFHGAKNELKKSLEELNQTKLTDECASHGIQWHFIPPAAPHMGGSWERMVRATKVALGAALELKNLGDEVLLTLIVEAEHVVNSHPLTYVPDDPEDPEALTPNHFLLGRSSNHQPIGDFDEKEIFGRKQWRISQQLANHFWRRWIHEYLPSLMRREKWNRVTRPVQVGDVVVEINSNLKRGSWPKGRIVRVYPGADKLVRVVDVKMAGGQVYRRPVSKLCILDVLPSEKPKQSPPEDTVREPQSISKSLQPKKQSTPKI